MTSNLSHFDNSSYLIIIFEKKFPSHTSLTPDSQLGWMTSPPPREMRDDDMMVGATVDFGLTTPDISGVSGKNFLAYRRIHAISWRKRNVQLDFTMYLDQNAGVCIAIAGVRLTPLKKPPA